MKKHITLPAAVLSSILSLTAPNGVYSQNNGSNGSRLETTISLPENREVIKARNWEPFKVIMVNSKDEPVVYPETLKTSKVNKGSNSSDRAYIGPGNTSLRIPGREIAVPWYSQIEPGRQYQFNFDSKFLESFRVMSFTELEGYLRNSMKDWKKSDQLIKADRRILDQAASDSKSLDVYYDRVIGEILRYSMNTNHRLDSSETQNIGRMIREMGLEGMLFGVVAQHKGGVKDGKSYHGESVPFFVYVRSAREEPVVAEAPKTLPAEKETVYVRTLPTKRKKLGDTPRNGMSKKEDTVSDGYDGAKFYIGPLVEYVPEAVDRFAFGGQLGVTDIPLGSITGSLGAQFTLLPGDDATPGIVYKGPVGMTEVHNNSEYGIGLNALIQPWNGAPLKIGAGVKRNITKRTVDEMIFDPETEVVLKSRMGKKLKDVYGTEYIIPAEFSSGRVQVNPYVGLAKNQKARFGLGLSYRF